jgi:hypothetical protein
MPPLGRGATVQSQLDLNQFSSSPQSLGRGGATSRAVVAQSQLLDFQFSSPMSSHSASSTSVGHLAQSQRLASRNFSHVTADDRAAAAADAAMAVAAPSSSSSSSASSSRELITTQSSSSSSSSSSYVAVRRVTAEAYSLLRPQWPTEQQQRRHFAPPVLGSDAQGAVLPHIQAATDARDKRRRKRLTAAAERAAQRRQRNAAAAAAAAQVGLIARSLLSIISRLALPCLCYQTLTLHSVLTSYLTSFNPSSLYLFQRARGSAAVRGVASAKAAVARRAVATLRARQRHHR